MAASTLTYTKVASSVFGDKQVRVTKITFSDGYVTNGFAITPSNFGLAFIDAIFFQPGSAAGGTFVVPNWDRTNGKLILLGTNNDADNNPLEQIGSDASIAGVAIYALVIGN